MDIILIPGLWLDASSWDAVVPILEEAGHRTHALTLPGMESKDADRSRVTLRDQVDAVIREIDAVDPSSGKVVLVGHSAGGGVAHGAVDARPDRVARVIYVGGEPLGDGQANDGGFEAENSEIPLPDWSVFDEEMVADLDEELRATLRDRAIPAPERAVRDPQRLSDDRRYDVPITMITCEYSSEMLKKWIEKDEPGAQELGRMRHVEYVDLNCGHWPQFTRPEELARAILASIDRA